MKSLETYLSESLYNHLSIDYELYEAAGLYDGIEDLCKFLTNKIKSHQEKEFSITYNSDDRELHNIKNVFFDNITLKCERSNRYRNDAECSINKASDININTTRFNNCIIYVYLSQNHNAKEVYTILLHEITHLWDNYNHILRYGDSMVTAKNANKYTNIIKSLDSGSIVGKILYFINPNEVNAWMASFAGYLYNNVDDKIIEDPKRALEIIKGSDLYRNYVIMGEYIDAIYKDNRSLLKANNIDIHELCNEYNKIYGTDFTEHKVRKQLYTQYQKVRQKIESNIGKICTKYVKDFKLR